MERFEITVGKEELCFAAAHFIPFYGGMCETLHGHNYRVAVTLAGRLDPQTGWVHDFVAVKRALEGLLARLDHRTLLPDNNASLAIETDEEAVRVRCGDRRFLFPRGDVVLLPVANTTAELLAAYLADGLADALGEEAWGAVERLELELEEAPGQAARCVRTGPAGAEGGPGRSQVGAG